MHALARLSLSLALLAGALSAGLAHAGNLNPPPGAVAPTDRKILSQATTPLPITISAPGNYVLTSDLALIGPPGANGILITSSNVTIDLNGFALIGLAGSGAGIANDNTPDLENVTIVNGSLRGWSGAAITLDNFQSGRFERLTITDCNDGVVAPSHAIIDSCVARHCPGWGFHIPSGGAVSACDASNSGHGFDTFQGTTVSGCSAQECSIGFYSAYDCTYQTCTAIYCGLGFEDTAGNVYNACGAQKCSVGFYVGDRNAFSNCGATYGGNEGFYVFGSGTTLSGCSATDNGGTGFWVAWGNTLTNCATARNYEGFYAEHDGNVFQVCSADEHRSNGFRVAGFHTSVINCSSTRNGTQKGGGAGIFVGGDDPTISHNHVTGNHGRGIWTENSTGASFGAICDNVCSGNDSDGIFSEAFNSRVMDNHCANNAGAGLFVLGWNNRVEGNSCANNGTGVQVSGGQHNLVIHNSATGNGTNFDIGANNTVGPIVNAATILTNLNPNANFDMSVP